MHVCGEFPRSSASHFSQDSTLAAQKSDAESVEGSTPASASHPTYRESAVLYDLSVCPLGVRCDGT